MPPPKKKVFRFSLSCGCRDSKSVSISEMPHPHPNTDMDSGSTTILASSSMWWEDRGRDFSFSEEASTTFSGLLRQLDELEKTISSLKPIQSSPVVELLKNGKSSNTTSRSEGGRVFGDSVAIVKNSNDPLSDFRRSMVQMIVENGIMEVEGLKELVGRYLALNSPEHHPAILRAFAELWNQVFPQFQMNTQDLLVNVK